MKGTVTWHPSAEDKLADLWMNAPDRRAVRDAADHIDQMLAYSPESKGEEFYGDRYLCELPLHVVFAVHPDDRRVEVLDVWSS